MSRLRRRHNQMPPSAAITDASASLVGLYVANFVQTLESTSSRQIRLSESGTVDQITESWSRSPSRSLADTTPPSDLRATRSPA